MLSTKKCWVVCSLTCVLKRHSLLIECVTSCFPRMSVRCCVNWRVSCVAMCCRCADRAQCLSPNRCRHTATHNETHTTAHTEATHCNTFCNTYYCCADETRCLFLNRCVCSYVLRRNALSRVSLCVPSCVPLCVPSCVPPCVPSCIPSCVPSRALFYWGADKARCLSSN